MEKEIKLENLEKGDIINIEYGGVEKVRVLANDPDNKVILLSSVSIFKVINKDIFHYDDYSFKNFRLLNRKI